jgi:hypothetical protein
MDQFILRHHDHIYGVLGGFDRMLFRGTLRSISYVEGMMKFLNSQHLLLKHFGVYVQKISNELKRHITTFALEAHRPLLFVRSSRESKEDIARLIMERDGIVDGLICILSASEPCQSYSVRGNAKDKKLELVSELRKCLHYYFYYVDREFGFMHIRIQSWLPMTIQVYINGREYLARELDKAGIGYERRDNCFARIDNLPEAQRLLDRLTTRKWERVFNAFAKCINPWLHDTQSFPVQGYYWTAAQMEFATDVMFHSQEVLEQYYPAFVRHAIDTMHSKDVLRFLGRRITIRFNGEIQTEILTRIEGIRVKHRIDVNSIKMYNKQGTVLRIEVTINNPRLFKVWRKTTRHGKDTMAWIPMRKAIVDLPRLVAISRAANKRYLQALAVIGEECPSRKFFDPISIAKEHNHHHYRPLHPVSEQDSRLLEAVASANAVFQGIKNKEMREIIHQLSRYKNSTPKQLSAAASRLLKLLCAHGLIYKVPKTQYYRSTQLGRLVSASAVNFRNKNIALLAA